MFITAYSQQLKREKTPGVHPQESGYQTACPHKETLLSNTQAQTTAPPGTDKPNAKLSRRTQTHTDCPYPTSRAVKPELDLKKTRQWLPLGLGPGKGDGDGPRPERTLPVCGCTHWPQVTTCKCHLKIKTKKNHEQILNSSRVTREKVCSICNALWNMQLKQGLVAGPDRWDGQTDSCDKEVKHSW